ncbi:unnamed protein product, partial [Rotaria sordida]
LIEAVIPGDILSLSAIRAIRVLRPLRAINRVPSMRILVMLLLDTLPMLGNVLLLCFFVFFIFGIVGVQLWKGLLRNRCFLQLNTTLISDYTLFEDSDLRSFYIPPQGDSFVCSQPQSNGMTKCSDIPKSRKGNLTCELDFDKNNQELLRNPNKPINACINWNQYYQFCNVSDKNPYSGAISFDNIGLAWVVIFQIISLESWVNIMYYIQDAHSFWDWIYFVCLIIIGSFFMINLCLVVIATQFSETKKRETERMLNERRRFSRSSSILLNDEPGSCWQETIKFIERLYKHAYNKLSTLWNNYRRNRTNVNKKKRRRKENINNKSSAIEIHLNRDSISNCLSSPNINLNDKSNNQYHQIRDSLSNRTAASLCPSIADAPAASPEQSDILDSIHTPNPHFDIIDTIQHLSSFNHDHDNTSIPSILLNNISIKQSDCYHQTIPNDKLTINEDEDEDEVEEDNDENVIKEKSKISKYFDKYIWSHMIKLQKFISNFVGSKYFRRIVLSAIVINTLSMGIEYHGQPPSLTNALEYSNLVFTTLFAIEMILKIIADGCLEYIKNAYNLFDSGIVIMSLIELQGNKNSGLSVLRTFRLLRVLKLVRFMPTLRRQLIVMLKTMDNVATFFSLLLLFIFIFSILGMNLFGCKFCKNVEVKRSKHVEVECSRKNFDSLLWAIITVFQVLTQEEWNEVLYDGMKTTSAWAALYFIALMTFGNYVLFNLLVAILVEGFSTEKAGSNSDNGSISNRLEKVDPFTSQALFTGDIEGTANPHELVVDETAQTNQDNKIARIKEVKIISIPKIAISNENDSSLYVVENLFKKSSNSNSNSSSPHKSIIKIRSSQPQSLSSSTTQSFHTCFESIDKQSRKISLPIQQNNTLSTIKNKSLTNIYNYNNQTYYYDKEQISINPIRRINSYQSSLTKRFIIQDRKLIEEYINQSDRIHKRRLTFDNFNYSIDQVDTSSIYETPKHDYNQPLQNSFRLFIDNDSNILTTINNQSDMQIDINTNTNQSQLQTNRLCLNCLCGKGFYKYFEKRENYSLYIFSPENRIRKALKYLILKKSFDYLILFIIALNCITLAMERPSIPPTSAERQFLNITNIIFTIIFTIEMMIKVIASGFIYGKHSYLRSGWNVMDGFLVIISIIDLATMHRGSLTSNHFESDAATRIFSMLRVFRLLRTLRPLRVISRAPGLKLVVQTLLSSLRPIGHIVVICCTFFIIFGILGVQLFKGKFYYCEGRLARDVTTKQQCEELSDHHWKNQQYNFDNLGQALLTLFVLSSRDGWVQIMYNGIDAVDVNMQPIRNYNEAKLIYFIAFLLLVGFFVLNMFLGVVIENFHKCRAEQEREEKARRTAKRAKKIERKRRRMRQIPYYAHFSPWRRRLHNICNSKYFDLIIAAVIGLNVVTMSLEFYLMPPVAFDLALDYCNYVFTTVFIIESISKIIALGPFRYFKDKWNQLDITIVILSIAGIFLEKINSGHILPINPTLIRVMRVLRIARVLKLLKMAKGIRALLDTVIQALPQVGNLGLLFFLLFFIFAALGVELFGKLECSEERPCTGLDKHAHFKDFGMAFLTLFRIATGDNWNGIMKDALRQDDSPHGGKNQFMTALAPIYFVIFVLMAQFVLVNVVVAVLMKKLDESNQMMSDDTEMDEEIERQLEADAQDRDYLEQPLIDDKEFHFLNDNNISYFPLTKQLSLPANFTFHSMDSITERFEKGKPIEQVDNCSLLSVISSKSDILKSKFDEKILLNKNEENLSLNTEKSGENENRRRRYVNHHRSNTVPRRNRKIKIKSLINNQDENNKSNRNQSFSISLLQIQSKQRRPFINHH